MFKHVCELAASALGFLGGAILSLDALFSVGRARSQRGKEAVLQAVEKSEGQYFGDGREVLNSTYAIQLLFARRSAATGRIGFGLMTLGFLLDFLMKW